MKIFSPTISGNAQLTGSLSTTNPITGSILSASYALTASYATTASYYGGSVISSSYAATASFVNTLAQTVNITGSLVITGSFEGSVVPITITSLTASMDCSAGNYFTLTLSSSATTLLNPTNLNTGQSLSLRITQPATSGSLRYTSIIKFPNGAPYNVSATGSAIDIVSFISFDSASLYASAIKNLV